MPSLRIICIAFAGAAFALTAPPAIAQKMTVNQAVAECKQQMGRGSSAESTKQQVQACVKMKMRGAKK